MTLLFAHEGIKVACKGSILGRNPQRLMEPGKDAYLRYLLTQREYG